MKKDRFEHKDTRTCTCNTHVHNYMYVYKLYNNV